MIRFVTYECRCGKPANDPAAAIGAAGTTRLRLRFADDAGYCMWTVEIATADQGAVTAALAAAGAEYITWHDTPDTIDPARRIS